MPIINQLEDEYREALIPVTHLYPSLGTIEIDPEKRNRVSFGGLDTIGINDGAFSGGGLQVGVTFKDPATSAIDTGIAKRAVAFGGLDTDGDTPPAFSSGGLDVNQIIDVETALATAEIVLERLYTSEGGVTIHGGRNDELNGSIDILRQTAEETLGALEVGEEIDSIGLAAISVGAVKNSDSIASIEMDAAESVPVIIDVIDATLNGGRGDC